MSTSHAPPSPRVPDSDPRALARRVTTHVVSTIAAAGIIGAASLAGGSYLALRDTQAQVEDVRDDLEVDIARVRVDMEHHVESGHPDVLRALARIDARLARIEERIGVSTRE